MLRHGRGIKRRRSLGRSTCIASLRYQKQEVGNEYSWPRKANEIYDRHLCRKPDDHLSQGRHWLFKELVQPAPSTHGQLGESTQVPPNSKFEGLPAA